MTLSAGIRLGPYQIDYALSAGGPIVRSLAEDATSSGRPTLTRKGPRRDR